MEFLILTYKVLFLEHFLDEKRIIFKFFSLELSIILQTNKV